MNNAVSTNDPLFLDDFPKSSAESDNCLDNDCCTSSISSINEETENSLMSSLNHATALIEGGNQCVVKYPKKYSFYFKNRFSSNKSDHAESTSSGNLNGSCGVLCSSSLPLVNEDSSLTSSLNSSMLPSMLYCDVNDGDGIVSTSECVPENDSASYLCTQENASNICSSNDNNFWCSECNKSYSAMECPKHPVLNIFDKLVQTVARATLPSIVLLKRIKRQMHANLELADAEYGIFAKNHLPRRVRFGPVVGVLENFDEKEKVKKNFMLSVILNESNVMELNVNDENTSNWIRFIRPAENFEEQNLVVDQHGSELYYTATRLIKSKEELRVGYSIEYAMKRKISLLTGDPYYRDVRMYIKYGIRPSRSHSESLESESKENSKDENSSVPEEIKPRRPRKNKMEENRDLKRTYKTRYGRIVKLRPDESDSTNSVIFSCKVCLLPFQTEALLNCHSAIHRKNSSLSISSEKTQHDEISSSEYVCPKCDQKFVDTNSLAEHVESHSLEKEYGIDASVSNRAGKDNKTGAEANKQRREVWCGICRGLFFDNHWRLHKVKKTYDCILCDQTGVQKKELRQHLKTHQVDGQFKCTSCSKVTDRYTVMYKHICHCHGELKTCDYCGRQFRDRHKLLLHILRHMNGKDFLCAVCGKQFSRADKLNYHVKNVHVKEREEPIFEKIEKKMQINRLKYETLKYKCHICKTGYRLLNTFRNHNIRNHQPAVEIRSISTTSPVNGEESSNQENAASAPPLVTHPCEWCFREYSKRGNLLMHQRKKHKEFVSANPKRTANRNNYTNQCDWCLKLYVTRSSLVAHQRRYHKELFADYQAKNKWNLDNAIPYKPVLEEQSTRLISRNDNSINLDQILNPPTNFDDQATIQIVQDDVQLNDINEEIEFTATIDAQVLVALKQSLKTNTAEIVDINQADEQSRRNTPNNEQYLQYLKLLSSNGVVVSSTADNSGAGSSSIVNVDNSSILQQFFSTYPFIGQ